ncbi:MAG TPA: hypothetical protein VM598_11490 [Bdellovibrionota bacterium]|nr:hypothetical protein [Bdellovibrionota bacterium]
MRAALALILLLLAPEARAIDLPHPAIDVCFSKDYRQVFDCDSDSTAFWMRKLDIARAAEQNAGPPPVVPEPEKPKEPGPDFTVGVVGAGGILFLTSGGYGHGGIRFQLNHLHWEALATRHDTGGGWEARGGYFIPVYSRNGFRIIGGYGQRTGRFEWLGEPEAYSTLGSELSWRGEKVGAGVGFTWDHTLNFPKEKPEGVFAWSSVQKERDTGRLYFHIDFNLRGKNRDSDRY